jgi:hypothetical protein
MYAKNGVWGEKKEAGKMKKKGGNLPRQRNFSCSENFAKRTG